MVGTLGTSPGDEMRAAFKEASKIPECIVGLADRPMGVTFKRLLSHFKFRYIFQAILLVREISSLNFTKEELLSMMDQCEVERFESDLPIVYDIMIRERDLYLNYVMQYSAYYLKTTKENETVRNVVCVVGAGHVKGTK